MEKTLREQLAGQNIQLKANEWITHAIVRMLVKAPEKTTWQLAQEYKKMTKNRQKEIQELAKEILSKQKRKEKRLRVGDVFQIDSNIESIHSSSFERNEQFSLPDTNNDSNNSSREDELIPLALSNRINGSNMIDNIDLCEKLNPTQKMQAKKYEDIPDTEDACYLKSSGWMSIRDKLWYTEVYITKNEARQ